MIKKIKRIFEFFEMPKNSNYNFKPTSHIGLQFHSLNKLFQLKNGRINLFKQNGKIYSEIGIHKAGTSQTWHFIFDDLFFFGLVKEQKYNEQKILKEFIIKEIEEYTSFDDYLTSKECLENIKRNFLENKEWFKGVIIRSFYYYIFKENIESQILKTDLNKYFKNIEKHRNFYQKNLDSYKNTLEKLFIIFDSKEIKEIQKFISKIENDSAIFEIEYIIKQRKYQTKFRKNLIKEFNGKCPISKTSNEELLIASHIVPYKDYGKDETPALAKIESSNGLLLSPNIDKLFDKNIISFNNENGKLIYKDNYLEDIQKWIPNFNETKLSAKFLTKERKKRLKERNTKYFKDK